MTGLYGPLLEIGQRQVETRYGRFAALRCLDLESGTPVLAAVLGDLSGPEPVLARVHSSCVTSEVFGARDCDCAEQLAEALSRIERAGRGVLFYLMQEGRGAGFVAKARDRMMVQASCERLTTFEAYERMGLPHDSRDYRAVAVLRRRLEIRAPLRLLTNNPDKISGLERAKVPVAGVEPLRHRPSPFNLHYLRAKSNSGHALRTPALGVGAVLPEPVALCEPKAVPGASRYALVASYLLPVALPEGATEAHWLRSRVYVDLERGVERVVLCLGGARGAATLRSVQHQRLLERLPLRSEGAARRRWRATLAQMVARGSGRALFLGPDEHGPIDPSLRRVLAHEPGPGL